VREAGCSSGSSSGSSSKDRMKDGVESGCVRWVESSGAEGMPAWLQTERRHEWGGGGGGGGGGVVGCVVRICVCVWCVSVWVKREAAGASASKQATGQTGVDLYV
jgi:uncharacterized membrane protein